MAWRTMGTVACRLRGVRSLIQCGCNDQVAAALPHACPTYLSAIGLLSLLSTDHLAAEAPAHLSHLVGSIISVLSSHLA